MLLNYIFSLSSGTEMDVGSGFPLEYIPKPCSKELTTAWLRNDTDLEASA
jgi:hypothetical protein